MSHTCFVVLTFSDKSLKDVSSLKHFWILFKVPTVKRVQICEHVVKLDGTNQLKFDEIRVFIIRLTFIKSEQAVNLVVVDDSEMMF